MGYQTRQTRAPSASFDRGSLFPLQPDPDRHARPTQYTFADTSRIQLNASAYQGNVSQYDFTLDHRASCSPLWSVTRRARAHGLSTIAEDNNATSIIQNGNELALILTEKGGGTKVSTTRNILYGTISASIKTTSAIGVVTAFITMSGTKDEIDWGACLSPTDLPSRLIRYNRTD